MTLFYSPGGVGWLVVNLWGFAYERTKALAPHVTGTDPWHVMLLQRTLEGGAKVAPRTKDPLQVVPDLSVTLFLFLAIEHFFGISVIMLRLLFLHVFLILLFYAIAAISQDWSWKTDTFQVAAGSFEKSEKIGKKSWNGACPSTLTAVDGRNPANHLRLVVYPIIYRVLYIPGGCLGFLPPTVGTATYKQNFTSNNQHTNSNNKPPAKSEEQTGQQWLFNKAANKTS